MNVAQVNFLASCQKDATSFIAFLNELFTVSLLICVLCLKRSYQSACRH